MKTKKYNQQKDTLTKDTKEMSEMMRNTIPTLDINFILSQGTQISSQDATKDISHIQWDEVVLNGKYKNKTIVKSKDEKE